MTKVQARTLGLDVDAALKAVAEKHGLDLEVRGGTYGHTFYRPKVEFKQRVTDDGVPREQADFTAHAGLYGLTPEAYGKTVMINGDVYAAIGFALTRSKFPLKVKRQRDGVVKFATHQTITALQRMGFAAASHLTEVPLGQILVGGAK